MAVNPEKSCCTPTRKQDEPAPIDNIDLGQRETCFADTISIQASRVYLGTRAQKIRVDYEGPLRRPRLKAYSIDRTAVTTARFAAFVKDTGYVTDAERFDWSFVFFNQLPDGFTDTRALAGHEWWRAVDGANWRAITGTGNTQDQCADHPVVHISSNDSQAFAKWAGGRLPTEAEWEHAARGGLGDVKFPWGDAEPDDTQFFPCNIWQGNFPQTNTAADDFNATAPADSFQPNGYGLMNMVGNVWEWTADPFVNDVMQRKLGEKITPVLQSHALLKGGSFLCHKSYCYRYRIAARMGNTPDSTSTHMGFRVVYDL